MSFSLEYPPLPITPHLPHILQTLKKNPAGSLVLTAETGAGKSTIVPLYLAQNLPGTILMLEPRRLAALGTASRMAELLNQKPGETCGYLVRGDSRRTAKTRVLTMTEAILSRLIMDDPSLPEVSAVILDEFHERSIHGDFAAALLREVKILREDLLIVVMSAAFETEKVQHFFDASVLHVEGRQFLVDLEYLPPREAERLEKTVVRAVKNAGSEGSVLVFLPGLAEIRRTEKALREEVLPKSDFTEILILHSSVSLEEQRRVLQNKDANRRIILSSSIAETSLTVPGIRTVIDSGLSRTTRFSVRTGMDRLLTEPENQFSALQRTGRAGRTAAGKCIRLWAQNDERPRTTPSEILRVDLMPLVLDCAVWSRAERSVLNWLDCPTEESWNQAQDILKHLDALNSDGTATQKGILMQSTGIHPRPAAMLLSATEKMDENSAQEPKFLSSADVCTLAAIASDQSNQVGTLTGLLQLTKNNGGDPTWKRRVESASLDIRRRLPRENLENRFLSLSAGELMLYGYPDRIGCLKDSVRGLYQFPSGRTAVLSGFLPEQGGSLPEYLVALSADSGEREGRIYLYEPLQPQIARRWLLEHAKESVVLFRENDVLKKIKRHCYGALILKELHEIPSREENEAALAQLMTQNAAEELPWNEESISFAARFAFFCLNGNYPRLKDSAAAQLAEYMRGGGKNIREFLGQLLAKKPAELVFPFLSKTANGSYEPLSATALLEVLKNLAGWETVSLLNAQVPETFKVPSGAFKKISYSADNGPTMEVKIQELFGLAQTPSICAVPLLLHMLSPAGRPLQITRDLANFWKETWPQVVKEMKGRYPKHPWPENPLTAEATWKTKCRKN